MKKIVDIFQNTFVGMTKIFRQDYLLHFFVGMVIATPMVIFLSPMEAIGFMTFIAIGKEVVWSQVYKIGASWQDVLFTVAPAAILILVKLLG
jgi:hypothetical protein